MHRLIVRCSLGILLSIPSFLSSQTADTSKSRPYEKFANRVISTGLASGKAIDILSELSVGIGPRLSGSSNAAKAVEWSKRKMEEF